MRRMQLGPTPAAGALILLATAAIAAGAGRLPVIEGQESVASVNGEPVTLAEFLREIGSIHEGTPEPASPVHQPDPSALLQRMVDVRLMVQEAKRIGLDRLPEVKDQMERIRIQVLKGALVREAVKAVTTADPAQVERRVREAVREVKLSSITFAAETDAKAFATGPAGDFDAQAAKAVADGKAREARPARFLKASDLRPEVAAAVGSLKPGGIGGPIRLPEGFSVIRLHEARYPEDSAVRARVEEELLQAAREVRLREYQDRLRARYVKVDRSLLGTLDYESKQPGLAALRRDRRVVARIQGGDALTVANLTEAVERHFYHGVDEAIERKRINDELPQILDRVAMERASLLEAKRLRLEQTDSFRSALKQQTDALLFDTFLAKVVTPEIKLKTEDLKAYYSEHRRDYVSPEMMRVETLAFRRREDAEAALRKLREGADLKWMRSNASGQADRKEFPDLLEPGRGLVVVAIWPEGLRQAVAGAAGGDFRLYEAPGGPSYVLAIREAVASKPRPYEAVKEEIAAKVFERRRQEVVKDWVARLRAASEVKVFASSAELKQILGLGSAKPVSGASR